MAAGALLGLAVPHAARAQTAAERVRLDSLHAQFETATDTGQLQAIERARISVARTNREDPFIHMELGWLALRLGEVTGAKRHYDDAAGEFQWAGELKPQWAYAYYWLGVAELALGESRLIALENIRQVLGIDYLSRAVQAFAHAIEVDPAFTDALVELATTTLRQRARGRVEVALEALRGAANTSAGRSPAVWMVRGKLERRIGAQDSAVIAFRRYLDLGGDPAIGGVEVARTLASLGRGDSAIAAYRAAINGPVSDSGRAEIRKDLRWIGEAEEMAAFDRQPADSLGAFVARFWSGRDVEDARLAGERLLEQFRRYGYAAQNFQLVSRRRAYNPAFAYRDTSQSDFDDRGVIYMRHGVPSQRVRYTPPGAGSEPGESWLYRRTPPEEDLVFHFAAVGDVQDWRLIESLAWVCAQGRGAPEQSLVENQAGVVDAACYGARGAFSDLYQRLERNPGNSIALADERAMVRRSVRSGITSDSYRMEFRGELRPIISTFVVGDSARRPELHVVFAIPAGRLHAVPTTNGVIYPLKLRVMVYDSADRVIALMDTLRTFRAAAALESGALTEQMVLRVPPGSWRVHVVVEEQQTGFGATVRAHQLAVPDMRGAFSASDLVIGRENSGLVWRRPGEDSVLLNPLGRFPEGSAATLYYEIYGLPAGASVTTRVVVRPASRGSVLSRIFGRASGAELSYTTVTDAAGRARVRQRVDLTGLKAGRYTLLVELTDPVSGQRIERRDGLDIAGRAP